MNNKLIKPLLMLGVVLVIATGCDDETVQLSEDGPLLSVAELTSQLSTGTDISFTNSSTTGAQNSGRPTGRPGGGMRTQFQDPNLAVLSIVERLGQAHNMRMFKMIGADVKFQDANGNELTIDFANFQNGSESFHKSHEAMADVAKIEINFLGTTSARGIKLSGKVTINRMVADNSVNETILFENFSVNGSSVEGTRTTQRIVDKETGEMQMTSEVMNGAITLSGGEQLNWASTKKRDGFFAFDDANNLVSGYAFMECNTILTKSDGSVWYSYDTTSPVKVDMACSSSRKQKPVSGKVQTIYNGNTIVIDFGVGSCGNKNVSVTINGVTHTRLTNG